MGRRIDDSGQGRLVTAARGAARRAFDAIYTRVKGPEALKEFHEYRYWRLRTETEGSLANSWYEYHYTDLFGISRAFYESKSILDVGCGPRGSLEWAQMASRRVGVDPLVKAYRRLGIDSHKMEYIDAYAEHVPFEDGSFDVVMSMNSLDHTNDPDSVIAEIVRVARPGGTILLLTVIDREPTVCEPHGFGLEVLERFKGCTSMMSRRRSFALPVLSRV
jgi:SAM-dependent methyltransferase